MNYRNLTLKELRGLASQTGKKALKHGAIIGLIGQLGSGKTTFTKALAKSLGIKSVKSPTFVVSSRYPLKKSFLYHLDFYRLENQKQLLALGLDEMMEKPNIVIIEWVEKFPQIKRKCDIIINLKVKNDNKRDVAINYFNAK